MEKKINKSNFKTLKNFIYKKSSKVFYIYAENKNNQSTLNMIEYAVRYTDKPAMAESRILNYDGEYVTFGYQRHKDNKLIIERVYVYDFFNVLFFTLPMKISKLFVITVFILKSTNFIVKWLC